MAFSVRKSHFALPQGSVPRIYKDPILEAELSGQMGGRSRTARPNAELFAAKAVIPKNLSLVSSLHGKLVRVLLTLPRYIFRPNGHAYRNGYLRLIAAMPRHTSLDIVVNEAHKLDAAELLRAAGRADGFTIYEFGDEVAFTVWAEDAYLTAVEAGITYFVEPFEFRRRADSVIADFVAFASDLRNTTAPLYFQGGNVLIGDDFFFVG